MAPHIALRVFDNDPANSLVRERAPDERVTLEQAASCDVVVLAVPVGALEEVVGQIAPHLHPGALVLDVGSVKMLPAEIMERQLPEHVAIVGTHPLFGPQSVVAGLAGLRSLFVPSVATARV